MSPRVNLDLPLCWSLSKSMTMANRLWIRSSSTVNAVDMFLKKVSCSLELSRSAGLSFLSGGCLGNLKRSRIANWAVGLEIKWRRESRLSMINWVQLCQRLYAATSWTHGKIEVILADNSVIRRHSVVIGVFNVQYDLSSEGWGYIRSIQFYTFQKKRGLDEFNINPRDEVQVGTILELCLLLPLSFYQLYSNPDIAADITLKLYVKQDGWRSHCDS